MADTENIGKVISISGPAIDVQFAEGSYARPSTRLFASPAKAS